MNQRETVCDGTNLWCTRSLQAAPGGTIGWRVEDVCGTPFKATCKPTHSDLPTGEPISQDCCQSPNSPNSDASSQQCPAIPSSLLDSSQTPSFTYFSLKAHGKYHLARTVFPASCEHPASQPLERCASDGLVRFIQVFLTECFNCRLTYISSCLKYLKVT